MNNDRQVPKTEHRGSNNAPEQGGSSAFAGIFMAMLFTGGATAFYLGAMNLNQNPGGPTKHSPIDPAALQNTSSADLSQREKVLQRQAALKKRLQDEAQRKIDEEIRK